MKKFIQVVASLLFLAGFFVLRPLSGDAALPPAAPADTVSISGRVAGIENNPLAGVTLSAEAVPGPAHKPPLVFVRDWLFKDELRLGECCTTIQMSTDDYFGQVDEYLAGAGYSVTYAGLSVQEKPEDLAGINTTQTLMDAIDQAQTAAGDPDASVILIAHGQGGFASREYIESDAYRDDVSQVFLFATPYEGAPNDFWRFATGVYYGAGFSCHLAPFGYCQLSDLHMQWFNRQYPERREGVTYHLVSGAAPDSSRNTLGLATATLLPGPDDGMTSQAQGLGLPGVQDTWATDEIDTPFGPGANDWSYYDERQTGVVLEHSRSFSECLETVLITGSSQTCAAGPAPQPGSSFIPGLPQHTGIDDYYSQDNHNYTRTLVVEGGPVLFVGRWHQSNPGSQMFLVDPAGQMIDPAYAAAHPQEVFYSLADLEAAYYFTSTLPGAWQIVVDFAPSPVIGVLASSFAAFQSPIHLAGGTDRDWYTSGDTAAITATLQGPYASAQVTATLIYPFDVPDIFTETLPLVPDGAGGFAASLSVPAHPGYAEVQFEARGVRQDGLAFEQSTSRIFQIAQDTVQLSGVYTETLHPRWPGANIYDRLEIRVGMQNFTWRKYGISADLVDAGGNLIDHDTSVTYLGSAVHALTLQFDGEAIYEHGSNGPFRVTNLLLTDQYASIQVVDEVPEAHTTAAYAVDLFGPPEHLYLPVLSRGAAPGVQLGLPAAVYTATTGVDGRYTFAALPPDTYRLTASWNGERFYPVSQYATPRSAAPGMDFDCDGCLPPAPDTSQMVFIPAGEFTFGCDLAHNDGYACGRFEVPMEIVYLDDFWIDKYEVTNAQYAACVAAGICTPPRQVSSRTREWYYGNPAFAAHPVIYVTRADAITYCTWAGKHLTSEAEWEKAARGPVSRAYPWGDFDPDCSIANFSSPDGICFGDTSQVGNYLLGASSYGVMDMGGNVYEWMGEWGVPAAGLSWLDGSISPAATTDYEFRRSGSYGMYAYSLRLVNRLVEYFPGWQDGRSGFRCAAPTGP